MQLRWSGILRFPPGVVNLLSLLFLSSLLMRFMVDTETLEYFDYRRHCIFSFASWSQTFITFLITSRSLLRIVFLFFCLFFFFDFYNINYTKTLKNTTKLLTIPTKIKLLKQLRDVNAGSIDLSELGGSKRTDSWCSPNVCRLGLHRQLTRRTQNRA